MLSIQGINEKSSAKKHNVYTISVVTNLGPVPIDVVEVATLPMIRMDGFHKIAQSLESKGKVLADSNLKKMLRWAGAGRVIGWIGLLFRFN